MAAVDTAIFYDSSRCTACKGCQVACKQWNQLPSSDKPTEVYLTKSYQSPLDLLPATWLIITFDERRGTGGTGGTVEWSFMRRSCFHCTEAACEMVCPVGAISHAESGAVVIDGNRCIGCGYCVNSCPFAVPKLDTSGSKAFKCGLCQDRQARGLKPACVSTCPTGALSFGSRAEMVSTARARLAEVKIGRFPDATLYGVDELGGLHVISLASRGLEAVALPASPRVPTAVNLMELARPLAGLAVGATVLGLGASYLRYLGYKRQDVPLPEVCLYEAHADRAETGHEAGPQGNPDSDDEGRATT
jgi:formate dehydrogenase iron-sulfur subunit